jgi:branched-chain amino acid aminotransferase
MQNAVVNVNGEILDPQKAKIPVFDRGYLYGDSLYEVIRSYGDQFLYVDEHLARLENSARLCRMVLTQSADDFRKEIRRTLEAFRKQPGQAKVDLYCRIIVTRGVGKIGFGLNCLMSPSQYVLIVQPLDPPTREQYQKGLQLKVSARLRNDRRALDPAMKSGNYLNSLLAYLEAANEDFDDALMCNADGHLTEGTTFNIFYVRNGIVATPPLDVGILDGITRTEVIRLGRQMGIDVREVRFPKERLYEADEVFMTSTIKEVFPVTRVDNQVISGGKPGPITTKLREAFQRSVEGILKKENSSLRMAL